MQNRNVFRSWAKILVFQMISKQATRWKIKFFKYHHHLAKNILLNISTFETYEKKETKLNEEIFFLCEKKLLKRVSGGVKFNYKTDIWYFLSIHKIFVTSSLTPLQLLDPTLTPQTFWFRMTAWVSGKEHFGFYLQRSQDSR